MPFVDDPPASTASRQPPARHAKALARVERVAHWMDRRYLDPVIGFFLPGVGDALGAVIGLYGVYLARKLGYPKVILARMMINLGLDSLVGAVPILGAVFDVFHKAHLRNLKLLQQRPERSSHKSDWLVVVGAVVLFVVGLTLPIVLVGMLIKAAF